MKTDLLDSLTGRFLRKCESMLEILHPPLDSWWQGSCSLCSDSSVPSTKLVFARTTGMFPCISMFAAGQPCYW